MPTWSNELPALAKHMGFDLKRTPPTSPLRGIATSDSLLVCDTHYWGGRTIPCERHTTDAESNTTAGNCPACNAATPYRTHVYIAVFDAKTHEHYIFECTSNAAKAFAEYQASAGTLRGCLFEASRPKGGKNSKVVIITSTANLRNVKLPDAPNLVAALSVIWRLPKTACHVHDSTERTPMDRGNHSTARPTVAMNPDPLRAQREQIDDAGGVVDIEARRTDYLAAINMPPAGNGHKKEPITQS